jgi:antitoxin component YwqK of YwqJK toxin-antitoxin module
MFINGKRNGLYKSYWKNGQLENISTYIDDKLNGECKSYYPNGQLYFSCTYIDSIKIEQ